MSDPLTRLNAALEGRYQIEGELGEGGMATVYLADDLKHERKVALKVLKPELAAVVGAERFLAEIKTTANLQHPHILPLFDSGAADGLLYYIMPFVDGEPLRDKIKRETQLPVEEALEITVAVAGALDYAHRQGVVHRDIKPGNILLHDGQPLVADFGIALAVSVAGGDRLTETGLSLGTPSYMSPEQVTGEHELDGRSDLYSLACVMYEMLAGERPFNAPTAQAVVAQILAVEPRPLDERRRTVPARVAAAVDRALEKLPADRFATAGDFAEALTTPAFTGRTGEGEGVAADHSSRVWKRVALVSTVVAIASLSAVLWTVARAPSSEDRPSVARMVITLPEDQMIRITGERTYPLAISGDGSRLVYVALQGGSTRLFVRNLDDVDARALPGTDGARQPFFSPDGEWVGFFAGGELRKVAISGGAPLPVVEASGEPFGATGGSDGTILYSILGEGLRRVSSDGGGLTTQVPINSISGGLDTPASYELPSSLERLRWPQFLPDGQNALVTTEVGTGVLSLETGQFRILLDGSQATYLNTGHLMFLEGGGRIRIVLFDLDRLEVTGPVQPALDNVFRGPGGGAANFVVSQTGTLVYLAGGFERSLVLVDRNGRETPIEVEPRGYRFPRISPDKNMIAVTVDPRPSDLWFVDIRRGTAARHRTDGQHDGWGAWSPDGTRIAFAGGAGGASIKWSEFPIVGEPNQVFVDRPGSHLPASWTSDDHILAVRLTGEGSDIVAIAIADGTTVPLVETTFWEGNPRSSPDGGWMAYVSNRSEVEEVYVLAYPEPGESHLVSIGGGVDPNWSADGTELFYRSGSTIMAVDVRTQPTFEVLGAPEPLFSGTYDFTQTGNWGVGPGGQFVMIKSNPSTLRQFQVVLNWFEELRQRMGN